MGLSLDSPISMGILKYQSVYQHSGQCTDDRTKDWNDKTIAKVGGAFSLDGECGVGEAGT